MSNRRRRKRRGAEGSGSVAPASPPVPTLSEQIATANDLALMLVAAVDSGTDAIDALHAGLLAKFSEPDASSTRDVLGEALVTMTTAYAIALNVIGEQRATSVEDAAALVLAKTATS